MKYIKKFENIDIIDHRRKFISDLVDILNKNTKEGKFSYKEEKKLSVQPLVLVSLYYYRNEKSSPDMPERRYLVATLSGNILGTTITLYGAGFRLIPSDSLAKKFLKKIFKTITFTISDSEFLDRDINKEYEYFLIELDVEKYKM